MPTLNTKDFLLRLSNEKTYMPIHSLYEVYIEDGESLTGTITENISTLEPGGAQSLWSNLDDQIKDLDDGNHKFLFDSQEITLPGGTTNFSAEMFASELSGGYIPGLVVNSRAHDNTFSISMREMNNDIALYMLEAWRRAISLTGFIEFELRKNIVVVEYGRAAKSNDVLEERLDEDGNQIIGSSGPIQVESPIRRAHVFTNAAPVSIGPITKSHSNQGEALSRSVTFAWSQYIVITGE